jgi:elongation factor 1 alpha-like protein
LIAPVLPRGGLLGGASAAPKTSKLQALAAARKKKIEATKDTKVEQAEQGISDLQLQEQTPARKENIPRPESSSPSKRQKLSEKAVFKTPTPATQAFKLKDSQQFEPLEQREQHEDDAQAQGLESDPPAEVAPPSAFAQALFGQPTKQDLPPPFILASARLNNLPDPFAEPSPDDVVLAAQAKGAISRLK